MRWLRPKFIGVYLAAGIGVTLGWLVVGRTAVENRLYKIGFDVEPPQHFLGQDGKPAGLAVELIDEAARRRGIRLQWQLEPEGSEAALKAKRVDLWPLMVLRPERVGVFYITAPYREDDFCLIVRSESAYTRLQDLQGSAVSFDGTPLDLKLLQSGLPGARLTVIPSAKESLEAVCQHRVDAAYLDEYTAIATLLAGASCETHGLRVIQIPELRGHLGLGATLEARPAADALRAEIGAMAADGSFAAIAARWRSFSGRNLELTDALVRAQGRERMLTAVVFGAVLLFLLTLSQAVGIRRAQTALRTKHEALAVALAKAREATELKSQFLAKMSHEIRTPMNGILGMTEVAMDTPDREERQDYLNDVMRSGQALLSLLNDILDFSKIEAGKVTLEHVDFDPAQVARDVVEFFAEGARGKGLELACRLPEPSPGPVRGDPARLRQVLVNLVSNGLKFTKKGSVELQVTVAQDMPHSLTLHFAVTDTGIGISADGQRRILELFTQTNGAVMSQYSGIGLGLSISKQLVTKMGGVLQVESQPGRGSRFWFALTFEKTHTGSGEAHRATPGISGSS